MAGILSAKQRKTEDARRSSESRPSKLARGMSFTDAMQDHRMLNNYDLKGKSRWVNSLCVKGTTDVLVGMTYLRRRKTCECCGSKTGPYILSESGRARLRMKRRLKEFGNDNTQVGSQDL